MRRSLLAALLVLACSPVCAGGLRFEKDTSTEKAWAGSAARYRTAARAAGVSPADLWDTSRGPRITCIVRVSGACALQLCVPAATDRARARALFERLLATQGIAAEKAYEREQGGTLLLSAMAKRGPDLRPGTWRITTPLRLAALSAQVRKAGLPAPFLEVVYRGSGVARLEGAEASRAFVSGRVFFFVDPSTLGNEVRLSHGLRAHDPWFIPLSALLALLAPLACVFLAGRSAQSDPDPAAGLFRMQRIAGTVGGLFPLIWLLFTARIHLTTYLRLALSPSGLQPWQVLAAMVAPMLLVPLAVAALTVPVERELRDTGGTPAQTFERLAIPLVGSALPIAVLLAALALRPRSTAEFLGIGGATVPIALVFYLVFAQRLVMMLGGLRLMRPQRISEGPLLTRVQALAGKAGVPFVSLYVGRTREGRIANALAAGGGSVLITDHLLRSLPPAEVDAIVAHELGHLKHRHPVILGWIQLGVVIAGVAASEAIEKVLAVALPGYMAAADVLVPLAWVGAVLVELRLSRYWEAVADRFAVSLTGDAPSCMRALYHLARVNAHPVRWSALSEKWATHPATARRLQAIADQAGLDEAAIAVSLDAAGSEERYPTSTEPADIAFGKPQRSWQSLVAGLSVLAAIVPLAGIVIAGRILGEPSPKADPFPGYVYLLALAAGAALLPPAFSLSLRTINRRVAALVAARLGVSPGTPGLLFCGISPGRGKRVYDGDDDRDVGFLWLDGDRLCVLGDRESFSLRRDQVGIIERRPQREVYLGLARVYVGWRETEDAPAAWLSIRPRTVAGISRTRRETRALAERLEAWRTGGSEPVPIGAPPVPSALPSTQGGGAVAPQVTGRGLLVLAGIAILCGVGMAAIEAVMKRHGSGGSPALRTFAGPLVIGLITPMVLRTLSRGKEP